MRYLVVSDIHGDGESADIINKLNDSLNPDYILCLGDILYHGPRNDLPKNYNPKHVIEVLNKLKDKIIAVRGNCEAEVDQMVLDFPCMTTNNTIIFNNRKLFMSHGHIYSPNNLPTLKENDIFLSGHTHIPTAYQNEDNIYLLNPGSITLPKENNPRTYAILEDYNFSIYTIEDILYMSITL